jgi:hypothetical protein
MRRRPLRPVSAWLLGLAAGFIGTWVAALEPILGVPIYALVAVALVLVGPALAFGSAMLLMTGLWFAYFQADQIANCARFNTGSGFCEMGDMTTNVGILLAFVFAGAALSVYALGKRSLRGGE